MKKNETVNEETVVETEELVRIPFWKTSLFKKVAIGSAVTGVLVATYLKGASDAKEKAQVNEFDNEFADTESKSEFESEF